KKEIILFKPVELSEDASEILGIAQGIDMTIPRLIKRLGWSQERVETGVKKLIADGIAVQEDEDVYFPGI
ncbi:MAG: hypothetical protein IH840_13905, partial [Candidatus Heimdallarchaeota archaeon]|nr:hypothetical protein [Candidatus Heimdallarchaeota archaeon]